MNPDLAGERMPPGAPAVRVAAAAASVAPAAPSVPAAPAVPPALATPPASAVPAGAAERTLVVLEAALEHPRFSDVVAATGLPKATVHRLLATLVAQRFLATDPAGSYLPGPALLSIAGRALAGIDISAIAQPFVDDLVAAVDCTVHIGCIAGDSIVYVMRSDSRKPYTMPSRVGHAAPLHTTGIGKVILASYPDDAVDRIIAGAGLARITDASITSPDAFRREIADVRSRGTARDRGENVPGIACIAAPLFDHTGTVRYGLSVSTLSIEHTDAQIEAMSGPLLEAAARISQALGYRGSAPAAPRLPASAPAPTQAPARTRAPGPASAQTPAPASVQSPAHTPAPGPASAQTPAPASAQSPAHTPAPGPASAQTPAPASAQSPASAQTPASARTPASAQSPAHTPAHTLGNHS